MGNTERAPRRAAMWIGASALVLAAGSWLRVPGIDGEELALAAPGGALGVIGTSVAELVVLRVLLALLGKTESSVARNVAFVIYIIVTAVKGLAIAMWAESLASAPPYFDVVGEPGWRFRITATLSMVAGAAVLWWLADRLDRTGVVQGALTIALLTGLGALFFEASARGTEWGHGGVSALQGLAPLAEPLAMIALAALLVARPPAAWPVTIARQLDLRSPLDVLAVPCGLAVIGRYAFGPMAADATADLVRAVLVVGGTVALAALWRPARPLGARVLWPLGLAAGALVLVAAPLAMAFTSAGGVTRALDPGPLAGAARFEITLAAVDRFAPDEAAAMARRIETLGAHAEVVSADAARITLRIEDAAGQDEVLDAIRPHTLALRLVDALPEDVPLPAGIARSSDLARTPSGPCDAVRAWAQEVSCDAGVERTSSDDPGGTSDTCNLFCLTPGAIATERDVVEAEVQLDPMDEQPVVTARLTDAAAARFERATGESIGRQLAIVVDGEVVSAPIIQSAIPGGRIRITLGRLRAYDELLAEATALATALTTAIGAGGATHSAWTLEAVH